MLTVTGTRTVFENRFVSLREDAVTYPDGSAGEYVYIERPVYAIVAAVEMGEIWLVEQWRHPLRRRCWELPMGVAPEADQIPPEDSARLELREETGLLADRFERVLDVTPAPALIAQRGVLFLATGLTRGPQALEDTEQDLVARPWPVERALEAALDGTITDAATIACLCALRLRGLI